MSNRRLPGYDYSQCGYYYVTICTKYRRWVFGRVIENESRLSLRGKIAEDTWNTLPRHYSHVRLHEYVFMPNHMHGIIELVETQSSARPSLSDIIRRYKGATTYNIRSSNKGIWFAWQDQYWDTVLFEEEDLSIKRQYILENPMRWKEDELYTPLHSDSPFSTLPKL